MFQTRRILVIVCVAAALLGNFAPTLTAQSKSDCIPPAQSDLKAAGPITTAADYSPVLLTSGLPSFAWAMAVGLPGNPILITDFDAWAYDHGVTSVIASVPGTLYGCRFEKNWGTFLGDSSGNLYRLKLVPGTLEPVASIPGGGRVYGLDIDPSNGTVYMNIDTSSGHKLYRLPWGSHSPKFVMDLTGLDARGLAVVGNSLYITDTSGYIWRAPKAGGQLKVFISGLDYPADIKLDASGNLFIADWGAGTILKVRRGTNKPEIIASGLANPHGVDVDQFGDVYFCEEYNGHLWKLARSR